MKKELAASEKVVITITTSEAEAPKCLDNEWNFFVRAYLTLLSGFSGNRKWVYWRFAEHVEEAFSQFSLFQTIMGTLRIYADYGYVILCLVLSWVVVQWLSLQVIKARKKYKIEVFRLWKFKGQIAITPTEEWT